MKKTPHRGKCLLVDFRVEAIAARIAKTMSYAAFVEANLHVVVTLEGPRSVFTSSTGIATSASPTCNDSGKLICSASPAKAAMPGPWKLAPAAACPLLLSSIANLPAQHSPRTTTRELQSFSCPNRLNEIGKVSRREIEVGAPGPRNPFGEALFTPGNDARRRPPKRVDDPDVRTG